MIIDVKRRRSSPFSFLSGFLYLFFFSLSLSIYLSTFLSPITLYLSFSSSPDHHQPIPRNSNSPRFAPRLLRARATRAVAFIFSTYFYIYTSLTHARLSTSGAPSRVVSSSYPVFSLSSDRSRIYSIHLDESLSCALCARVCSRAPRC